MKYTLSITNEEVAIFAENSQRQQWKVQRKDQKVVESKKDWRKR